MITARSNIDTQDAPREVSRIEGAMAETVTIALAAGASDAMEITVTVKDGFGKAVTGVRALDLWFSGHASSGAITGTSYSGTLVASTGSILTTVTSAKRFEVLTNSSGVFVGSLTATAKPATEYVVVRRPFGGELVYSAASGTNWGA